jgi:hypothetical protein
MTNYVTPGGKKIVFKPIAGTVMMEIVFESGGERPPEFDGAFTDAVSASKAVEKYLNRASQKRDKKVA